MIVDHLELRELDCWVERSARLRWNGGSFRLRISVPAGYASAAEDGSPLLASTLLLAMRLHEDLEVEAPVSPRLLGRTDLIQRTYHAWDPSLRPCAVRTGGDLPYGDRAPGVASLFSRGIDSMFTAGRPRPVPPQPDRLLFSSTFDVRETETARAEQVRLTSAAADRLGLPLIEVRTNLRELTEPFVAWTDVQGAALASVALATGGAVGHVVVPSSHFILGVTPWGTGPLLDPLFSTETVEIEHDSLVFRRGDKLAWIVQERPDLLPLVEVCQERHEPGNCGKCGKCVQTAVLLEAAGAPGAIEGMPSRVDTEAVRAVRKSALGTLLYWVYAYHALAPDGHQGELREAIGDLLRRSARPRPIDWLQALGEWRRGRRERRIDPTWVAGASAFARYYANTMRALVRDGRPHPAVCATTRPPEAPAPRSPASTPEEPLGLTRVIDWGAGKHSYGVGLVPPGELVGELGALERNPAPDTRAVWLRPDRKLAAAGYGPPVASPSRSQQVRWILAPLSWRGLPASACARAMRRRLLELFLRRPALRRAESTEPLGYLAAEAKPMHRPLYAAIHPITGDQLLTVSKEDAAAFGYSDVTLLGHLLADAPVTGRLETRRPYIWWASRLGQT